MALVTGAGSGIGEATARLLAEAGARVLATDIDAKAAEATAAAIRQAGGEAAFAAHDVAEEVGWRRAVEGATGSWGRLDILVNNAGIISQESFEDMSLATWHRLLAVDLDGVFLGLQHAIRAMKPTGGSIINISSVLGIVAHPSFAAYGAAKGGVRSLTKAIALYCCEHGYRIRVNSVHPSFILTPMTMEGFRQLGREKIREQRDELMRSHPIGRLGEPMDVARAVLFLASDDSSFITGTELTVDGGYTAR